MGQTIHHHATTKSDCPVRALARRVHHILTHAKTSEHLLCDYWIDDKVQHITPQDIKAALRQAVTDMGLSSNGLDPDLVGVHSLRAGGAMALKLHKQSDTTIMKLGRWKSLTFLMYIHNQIGHLSKDLSQKMSRPIPFLNIAAIEAAQP